MNKVLIVDPSLFTAAYDKSLLTALDSLSKEDASELQFSFWGRPQRSGEPSFDEFDFFHPHFYRFSEAIKKQTPMIGNVIKFFEHILNWFSLYRHVKKDFHTLHLQWIVLPWVEYFFLKKLKGKVQLILTVHDTTPFLGSPTHQSQMWGWHKTLKIFDTFIVHTPASQKVLESWGIMASKIYVSPMGSTITAHKSKSTESRIKTILLFGIIRPYKGVDLLIEAFANIPSDLRSSWRVNIVGKAGMDMTTLHKLVEKHNLSSSVLFDTRYVEESEISTIASGADIFCFPYRHIDTSAVLMNMLEFEKPIVASQVGVFSDLLTHNVNALMFTPGDAQELSIRLMELMKSPNLRDLLSANLTKLNQEKLSWNASASIHKTIYQNIGQKTS